MKASVIFLFSVLLAFTSVAQDNKLSLGIVGGVDMFSNKALRTSNLEGYNKPPNDYGYNYGLQITYPSGEKMGIRAGVVYARKEFQQKTIFGIFPAQGTAPRSIYSYRLNYLEIPISIYYSVIQSDRFRLAPSLGIKTAVFINGKRFSNRSPDLVQYYEPQDDSRLIIGPRIGLITDFKIAKKTFLSLEPHVAFSYNSLYAHSNQNIYVFWGISLSLNYGLK